MSLGVAFQLDLHRTADFSIFLMFLVHQLQLMQERLVFDTENLHVTTKSFGT